jgi:hypothetical protein
MPRSAAAVVAAEPGQPELGRPVRLRRGVPGREQPDDQLRRQPPPEQAPDRPEPQGRPHPVQRAAREQVPVGIGRRPVQPADRRRRPGGPRRREGPR